MELTDTAFLHELSFLKGLAPDQFETVTRNAWTLQMGYGQKLFAKGEAARRCFIVLAGRIGIMSGGDNKPPVKIRTAMAGDILGWSWLVSPHSWRFGAVAEEPATVLVLDGEQLRDACERDPALGYEMTKRMLSVLVSRLESALLKLADRRRSDARKQNPESRGGSKTP